MSLASAQMGEAVGLSHLYPVVPIMNFFSMLLLLLVVPRFWKTRIVALVSVIGWIFLGNLVSFLGMIHWRGHTNDAPVWASILAFIGSTWYCGFFTSMACFAHFTWQRLQPLSARQLYDTRRRDNLIHLFLTLILPVLWAPLSLLSCDHRYLLIEDFGPIMSTRQDWPGSVVRLPPILGYAAVEIFGVLALVRYWHAKQVDVESDALKHHPSVRTRKLLLMAVANTLLAAYGIYNQFIVNLGRFGSGQVSPKSLAENINSLQSVLMVTRPDLDTSFEFTARFRTSTAISTPLLGFYVFAWFGCGTEARKAYGEGLLKFGRLVGIVGTLLLSWLVTALHKAEPQQSVVEPLPFTLPDALQDTPYISSLPREHVPQPPAGPMTHPSSPVGNVMGSKRRVPPKDPVRRLSNHKPPFVPLDPTNTAAHAIASVPNPPARRLSYHKPALRPLDPDNPIPSTRRQENFSPRSQARRLSYHKPLSRPLVSASVNTRGAIPDVLGTSMPLVDIQRKPKSSGATQLSVAGAMAALPPPFPTWSTSMPPLTPPSQPPTYLAPPPLSSPSTSTAPPSLSPERTSTPAPPYQDLYPFFNLVA